MRFRIMPHSTRIGELVVEVFDSLNRFIASISSGNTDRELRIISKHITDADVEAHFGLGPEVVRAIKVSLAASTDPAAPLTPSETALEEAILNLHRVILSDPKRKCAILAKRVHYDILPSEITVEEAEKMSEYEIVAVMQNLEKPAHAKADTAKMRSTEATSDEVIVRCDICQRESEEYEWIALDDCCPVCGKQRKLDPRTRPEVRRLLDYIKEQVMAPLKNLIGRKITPEIMAEMKKNLIEACSKLLPQVPGVSIVAVPPEPGDDPGTFYGRIKIEKQALSRLDPRWLSTIGVTPEQAAECGEEGLAVELERLKWFPDQEAGK